MFLSHHHVPIEQCACSYSAEGDDKLWLYYCYLLLEVVRRASFDFIVGRVTVLGRAALDDIGDVNFLAPKSSNLEEFIQKFSRASHEGFRLDVFVEPWGLPAEHDLSIKQALTWDSVFA